MSVTICNPFLYNVTSGKLLQLDKEKKRCYCSNIPLDSPKNELRNICSTRSTHSYRLVYVPILTFNMLPLHNLNI